MSRRTTDDRDLITESHVLVHNHTRIVEFARRRFVSASGTNQWITLLETRDGRRFTIDLPHSAIDDAIAALCALRASVVAEHGAGSTQRRGAPMHGTWMPTNDGAAPSGGRSK